MTSVGRLLSGAAAQSDPAPSFKELLLAKIEEVNARWQAAMRIATAEAFKTGHAAGELAGRQALALELQSAYGIEGGEKPMTAEDLAILAKKQIH